MSAQLEDEFGDIIRKARVGHGYAVEQMSPLSAIPATRLAGFESYELTPEHAEVEAIAAVLELNAAKLWEIAVGAYLPKPEPWRVEPQAAIGAIPVDVGGYFENCYVVSCNETKKAVVFDPGGNADGVAGFLAENDLIVEAVAITHGHADHTSGVLDIAARVGIHDFYMHGADMTAIGALAVNQVSDGDEFYIGNLAVRVLHTPGHTAGSLCYRIGRLCVVGDTLFAGSIGRAMGGAEYYQKLLASVRTKLLSLRGDTALLPGHGPATTVEEELSHNPFF